MKDVELYAKVRHAVRIEGLMLTLSDGRHAASIALLGNYIWPESS